MQDLTRAISLPTRRNLLLNNTRSAASHFINCRCTQVLFQLSEDVDDEGNAALPDFEGCYFNGCSFTDLFDDAEIVFKGKNIFYNCTFSENQKVVINDDCEFYNCSVVDIKFAENKTYNIKAVGSELRFSSTTDSNSSKTPLNLVMNGGKLVLPKASLIADWNLRVNGAEVEVQEQYGTVTGGSFMGCIIQAKDQLYMNMAVGCNIYFNGASASEIRIDGMILVANEIVNGTPDSMSTNKTGLVYGAEIDVANRQNMMHFQNSLGSNAEAVGYNFNGLSVTEKAAESATKTNAVYKANK